MNSRWLTDMWAEAKERADAVAQFGFAPTLGWEVGSGAPAFSAVAYPPNGHSHKMLPTWFSDRYGYESIEDFNNEQYKIEWAGPDSMCVSIPFKNVSGGPMSVEHPDFIMATRKIVQFVRSRADTLDEDNISFYRDQHGWNDHLCRAIIKRKQHEGQNEGDTGQRSD